MIKAPFNFVPLNEKPYLADWAGHISQDIPFEDGISGTIKLKIETKTPTFVGDEVKEDNTQTCEFCHVTDQNGRKQYFIPGTSIKGMIRNVMEILSFGKMTQVQNQSFGIRELDGRKADGQFYHQKVKASKVHCGWLRYEKGKYLLKDCGYPWRISTKEIDELFPRIGLTDFITKEENFKTDGTKKSDENRTAHKKYELFHKAGYADSELTGEFMNNELGTIVFTGQPGARKDENQSGKFKEFIFPVKADAKTIEVSEYTFKSFESVHQNSVDYVGLKKKENEKESQIDCYRSKLRAEKEIPIFFTYFDDGTIDSMGLAYMYKYPAFNSVYNGIPEPLLSNVGHDLCECVFGYIGKEESLKGRIQFSSAMLTSDVVFCEDTKLALAKPHPSYYPLYLGNGQTWNTESVRIAGRKRYPVKNTISRNEGTDNMTRIIRPLKQEATFEGTIRFHNLRPIEVGALLSSIDFCQHEECFHSIGQGKPLGYGKVKLSVTEENMKYVVDDRPCTPEEVREAFQSEMERNFSGWSVSQQLKELFAMAKGIPVGKEAQFQYMQMSTDINSNEFKVGLTQYSKGEQLGVFTQILAGNVPRISQRENVSANAKREDIELKLANAQKRREELLERKAQELEQQRQEAELAQQREIVEGIATRAYEALNNRDFIEAKKLFEEADKYGIISYQAQIDDCQEKIDNLEKQKGDIFLFLASVKLASINAFATQMKKRHEAVTVTSADIPFIIQKIEDNWNDLKPKERKPWLDRRSWSAVEKVLGADITNAIYDGIKELPAK